MNMSIVASFDKTVFTGHGTLDWIDWNIFFLVGNVNTADRTNDNSALEIADKWGRRCGHFDRTWCLILKSARKRFRKLNAENISMYAVWTYKENYGH